jgi:hypothetical protein
MREFPLTLEMTDFLDFLRTNKLSALHIFFLFFCKKKTCKTLLPFIGVKVSKVFPSFEWRSWNLFYMPALPVAFHCQERKGNYALGL